MSKVIECLVAVLLLMNISSTALAEEKPDSITIDAEAWVKATEADGTGIYWDLLRAIYEPVGISVKTNTSTYTRSVGLVKTGAVNAMVGAYADEVEGVLYSKNHFDADVITGLFRKDNITWEGESSLKDKHVATIKGYELDQYISVPFKRHEYRDRDQILTLLEEGKVDFFVDAQFDLLEDLKKPKVPKDIFDTGTIKQLKIYMIFPNNETGEYFRDLFDQRFNTLMKNGDIKKLFEKWNWPTYPF